MNKDLTGYIIDGTMDKEGYTHSQIIVIMTESKFDGIPKEKKNYLSMNL